MYENRYTSVRTTTETPTNCTIFARDARIIPHNQLIAALWEAAEESTLQEVQREHLVLNLCESEHELKFINRFYHPDGCTSRASLHLFVKHVQQGDCSIYGFITEEEGHQEQPAEEASAVSYLAPFDETLRPISIGRQIEMMLGFPVAAWLNNADFWCQHLHPDDCEDVLAQRWHCYTTEQPFCCEYRMRTGTGQYIWLREEATPVLNGCERPQYMQGTLLDITRRKQYEEHINQRQTFASAIVPEQLYEVSLGM